MTFYYRKVIKIENQLKIYNGFRYQYSQNVISSIEFRDVERQCNVIKFSTCSNIHI